MAWNDGCSRQTAINNKIETPRELAKLHEEVTLDADVFFIDRIPFFMTMAHDMLFATTEWLVDRKINAMMKACQHVFGLCDRRGFRITTMNMDMGLSLNVDHGPMKNLHISPS